MYQFQCFIRIQVRKNIRQSKKGSLVKFQLTQFESVSSVAENNDNFLYEECCTSCHILTKKII